MDFINDVQSVFPDDVDILATKMNIKGRILGYREKAIFHIIWIDKDHKGYKG